MAGAVDIMDRDKPGARAFFAPGADPAKVVDIAQADDGDPLGAGLLQAQFHRLLADHLTIAHIAVEQQIGAVVAHHGDLGADRQGAFLGVIHVTRRQADAMAVMAHQIGLHQVFGDRAGLALGAAGAAHHGDH